jgi:hypothetical protein
MTLYLYRLFGAMALDPDMYEGIEGDRSVTGQAVLTVVLASIAAGLGASGWTSVHATAFLTLTAIALVTWVAWAVLICEIGRRLLPEPTTRTNLGELLRTVGFAAAPGLLQVFALLPRVGLAIFAFTVLWMFVAMVVAVQHALDYRSVWRAVAVCLVAGTACLSLAFLVGVLLPVTIR